VRWPRSGRGSSPAPKAGDRFTQPRFLALVKAGSCLNADGTQGAGILVYADRCANGDIYAGEVSPEAKQGDYGDETVILIPKGGVGTVVRYRTTAEQPKVISDAHENCSTSLS
jgi:hypothetical protein